jgi:hypothetical protein
MSVIADSPLGYERGYRAALRIAKEASAVVAVVECVCSDDAEWRRRIESRSSMGLAGHHATGWQRVRDFFARTAGLEYVPRHRRRELVERLLGWSDRLIIGVFNEEAHARPTEELLRSWGHRVAGRSERANRKKPGIDYRVLWLDG